MKFIKYWLLLFIIPLAASCDHNDDLPDIDVTVTVKGCVVNENTIYVVKNDGFEVISVDLVNHGKKNAVIGSVVYLWDYARVGDSVTAPYSYKFNTSSTEPGTHLFQMEAAIYAVDYAPAIAFMSYNVVVVESTADLPQGTGSTSENHTLQASIKKDESKSE